MVIPRKSRTMKITAMVAAKYTVEDLERLRKKYKPGQEIKVTTVRCDGEENAKPEHRRYIVDKLFPYHASCIDRNGMRESFGYFELEQVIVGR